MGQLACYTSRENNIVSENQWLEADIFPFGDGVFFFLRGSVWWKECFWRELWACHKSRLAPSPPDWEIRRQSNITQCNLPKLQYFTNLDFPEIRGFPILSPNWCEVVWGCYNLTRCNVFSKHIPLHIIENAIICPWEFAGNCHVKREYRPVPHKISNFQVSICFSLRPPEGLVATPLASSHYII